MIKSTTFLLAILLSIIELLPLCVGVKMEDFKVGLQGSILQVQQSLIHLPTNG